MNHLQRLFRGILCFNGLFDLTAGLTLVFGSHPVSWASYLMTLAFGNSILHNEQLLRLLGWFVVAVGIPRLLAGFLTQYYYGETFPWMDVCASVSYFLETFLILTEFMVGSKYILFCCCCYLIDTSKICKFQYCDECYVHFLMLQICTSMRRSYGF